MSFKDFVRKRDGKEETRPQSLYPRVRWVRRVYHSDAKGQILYFVRDGIYKRVTTCPKNTIPPHTTEGPDYFCLSISDESWLEFLD